MAIAIKKKIQPGVLVWKQQPAQAGSERGYIISLLKQPVLWCGDGPKWYAFFSPGLTWQAKAPFIKSVGTAVFLAHVGMRAYLHNRWHLFDGMPRQRNVIDNIAKAKIIYNEITKDKDTIR
jgi:hypothetical protein